MRFGYFGQHRLSAVHVDRNANVQDHGDEDQASAHHDTDIGNPATEHHGNDRHGQQGNKRRFEQTITGTERSKWISTVEYIGSAIIFCRMISDVSPLNFSG
jgi:hypothetical protein